MLRTNYDKNKEAINELVRSCVKKVPNQRRRERPRKKCLVQIEEFRRIEEKLSMT